MEYADDDILVDGLATARSVLEYLFGLVQVD